MSANVNANNFRSILRLFLSSFPHEVPSYASGKHPVILPQFSSDFLIVLFHQVQTHFRTEPTVLQISPPCIVVGDLHGQVLDLIRILSHYRDPIDFTYLFLGDLVDRGQFSLETVILVYLLKVVFPTRVFIIRGNHEFSDICSRDGFLTQILSVYNFLIFQDAVDTFSYLPLVAQIGKDVLCLHGGIGPQVKHVGVIRTLRRPIDSFGNEKVDAIVWSDPSDRIAHFEPSHTRGMGFLFGEAATDNFLRASNLKVLIRAHECVSNGFRWDFSGKILTVFSASNYQGSAHNLAAVAEVIADGDIQGKEFAPLAWVTRAEVEFRVLLSMEGIKAIPGGGLVASLSVPKWKKENRKAPHCVIRRRSSPVAGELKCADKIMNLV
jgi:protein phosphatase